jgi:DNA polymerase-3 subunit delta'
VSWQDVQGHDAQVQALAHALARGRLAHAYLFVGPPGVGKRLFAGELGKALLCDAAAGTLRACDHCAACTLVKAGTHPDLFVVGRPAGRNEVPIDVMRELCRGFALKPARGRGKVAILDDADDLNEEAANCFLKTLEEPPPRSVFILIGTQVERQLPTVLSRCQVVRFAPLPEPQVTELLRRQGVPEPLLARLAKFGAGSPGQALALADPEAWEFRRALIDGLAEAPPDTVGLARRWREFAEEAGKDTAAHRRRAGLVLRLLIEFLNDAAVLSVGGTPRLAEADDLRALRALAGRVSPETLLELVERGLEADAQIERYVQLPLVLEGLLDALGQRLARPA